MSGENTYGVDTNQFHPVDMDAVSPAVRFVVGRAKGSEGGRDSLFRDVARATVATGRWPGSYGFARWGEVPEEWAHDFCDFVIDCGYGPGWLHPWLDLEAPHGEQVAARAAFDAMSAGQREDWAVRAAHVIEANMGGLVIYTNRTFWFQSMAATKELTDRPVHVARYSGVPWDFAIRNKAGVTVAEAYEPWAETLVVGHQYTSSGKDPGIVGNVDLNVIRRIERLIVQPRGVTEVPFATILGKAGLDVENIAVAGAHGSFTPEGIMLHHTAVAGSAKTYVRTGSPIAPLCNLLLERTGRWVVITNGKANHAGRGSKWALSEFRSGMMPQKDARERNAMDDSLEGNQYLVGIEVENDGIGEPYPEPQLDALIKGLAALCRHFGWRDAGHIGHHRTYTARKIDMSWRGNVWGAVNGLLGPLPVIPPKPVKVAPMFDPPHRLPPVVASLRCPQTPSTPDGGVWLLGEEGSVWAYEGAPYLGAMNGTRDFVGMRAVQLRLLDAVDRVGYVIVTDTGHEYGIGGEFSQAA